MKHPFAAQVDAALERANAAARDVDEYRGSFIKFWKHQDDRSEPALKAFFLDACADPADDSFFARSKRRLSISSNKGGAKTMSLPAFKSLLQSLEETRVANSFAERLFTEMAVDTEFDFDEFKSYLIGRGKFSAIGAHAEDIFGAPASLGPSPEAARGPS